MKGKLSIVATPIGNLEDITLRAIKALNESDAIVCEDTRRTHILLNHYNIRKNLISFYSYNQFRKLNSIMSMLEEGKKLALVSDSGTPGISDPGAVLIKKAIDDGYRVESIPGPTALISALVCSGLPTNGFIFLGFLPKKEGKIIKILSAARDFEKTVIFYESPYRTEKTLEICRKVFGDEADCVIARELTKIYEEYIRDKMKNICENIGSYNIKGEIVVLINKTE